MGKSHVIDRSFLEDAFGKCVLFNKTERRLYAHDVVTMSGVIKPLIGNTIPDAVVQPEYEQELIDLVLWAEKNKIPL